MKNNQSGNLLEQETAQPIPAQPREGRPANLPAKFWDEANGRIKIEELIEDYNYMASRDENLIETNKRNMPASYDQYRINIPNELLDHDEELFKQFYEHGFTNDQARLFMIWPTSALFRF